MNAKESVEKLLEDLERQLLVPRARKSKLVFELLAEEFVEFRSSGRQFTEVAQMKTRWILLPETEADHAWDAADGRSDVKLSE